MSRLVRGDDKAMGALMLRWEGPLKRFLYRLLLNADEAAELAQESFVRLYQQRARYRAGAPFAPWLLTIAANLARNRRRWWHRHPTLSLEAAATTDARGGAVSWEPVDPAAGPAEQSLAAERAALVRRAVAALPHELREVVVLAEFEARPQAEVGEILGCSPKAVEMRLYRARARLRRSLAVLE